MTAHTMPQYLHREEYSVVEISPHRDVRAARFIHEVKNLLATLEIVSDRSVEKINPIALNRVVNAFQ